MNDDEFDAGLVTAAFALAGLEGWGKVSAAAAAQHAGLDLARARLRFSGRGVILRRFGALADAYALTGAANEGSVRDRLFDLLLRRYDFLQNHRAGVLALLRFAPLEPGLSVMLACETGRSMAWLLAASGVSPRGLRGGAAVHGLVAVWGWGLRAWIRDESEDLSATMAAVDVALSRADAFAARFGSRDGFTPEAPEAAAAEPAVSPDDFEPEPPLGGIDDPAPPGVPPAGMPGI